MDRWVDKGEVEGGSKTPEDRNRGTMDAGKEKERILQAWTA
jgi:hypothetical protein